MCLKRKSDEWVQRLDVERKCWKYCVFYTLTYAPESVPYLSNIDNAYLADLTHIHQAAGEKSPLINIGDLMNKCTMDEKKRLLSFLDSREQFPYLSVYDSQKFIKRLRKNLKNKIKATFKDYDEKDYFIRYYHIGELGSTTFRPHYHGLLFFSSEKEASVIQEVICKSWQLGIVDSSFVAESNSRYLAKYLNCDSNMPAIYRDKSIRPFAIFSRRSPIGTLYFNDTQVREIFDSCTPSMLADYTKEISLKRVPLWKTFENRLFPKLALFNQISHFDRIKLYRASLYFSQNYELEFGAADFAHYMLNHAKDEMYCTGFLALYKRYIDALQHFNDDIFGSLMRWFYISNRVCTQAAAFNITVDDYVEHIERYVINKESENLKEQLRFEEKFSQDYSPEALIGLDKLYLESILDVPLEQMSAEEITTLQSYGIDIQKFTSDDLSERLEYQCTLLPEYTRDYLNLVIDTGVWMKKHTKTKVKNDYLSAHPDLINSYNNK